MAIAEIVRAASTSTAAALCLHAVVMSGSSIDVARAVPHQVGLGRLTAFGSIAPTLMDIHGRAEGPGKVSIVETIEQERRRPRRVVLRRIQTRGRRALPLWT